MRAAMMILLAGVSAVGVASPQAADTVPRGTRVRVTPSTPSSVVVGELIEIRDSALVIRTQGYRGDVTIPRSAVMRLEVSRGTTRAASAGWGALIGLGVGGLLGVASWYRPQCGYDAWFCMTLPTAFAVGGILGTPIGTVIGFAFGFRERWKDAAVPVDLSIVPSGGQSLSIVGRVAF